MSITDQPAPTIRTLAERVEFTNQYATLYNDDVILPNGTAGKYLRFRSGTGFGGVVIPRVLRRHMEPLYGLVRQYRYAVNDYTLEFPGGFTRDLSSEEAGRELQEEVGNDAVSMISLGSIFPNPGLEQNEVSIWLGVMQFDAVRPYVESESGACTTWLSAAELEAGISNGEIRSGITLAAWSLLKSSQFKPVPVM